MARERSTPPIEGVWQRITIHQGETFKQVKGKEFRYEVRGAVVRPDTTNQNLSKSTFEKALPRLPLRGPGDIHDLRGPSYVCAILMDARIRGHDW